MERLLDWFDRHNQRKADFPATILAQRVHSDEEANAILSTLPLWTYRSDFPAPLPHSTLTTDRHWGCLIRTSQMLLAHALQMHGEFSEDLFRDVPEAPFSIHAFVQAVLEPHKEFEAKFWGPSQGCEAIRVTLRKANLRTHLPVLVGEQGCIYSDEIIYALSQSPVLLLLPVRPCAAERITQSAFMIIEQLLSCPFVVGIVGGVPRRSYFFIGTCDASQRLIYLDPHVKTQPAFTDSKDIGHHFETIETVGCVDWKRIDSSLLIGVYLKTSDDYSAFVAHLNGLVVEDPFLHVERSRTLSGHMASVDDVSTF